MTTEIDPCLFLIPQLLSSISVISGIGVISMKTIKVPDDVHSYLKGNRTVTQPTIVDVLIKLIGLDDGYCKKHNQVYVQNDYFPYSWYCPECKKMEELK